MSYQTVHISDLYEDELESHQSDHNRQALLIALAAASLLHVVVLISWKFDLPSSPMSETLKIRLSPTFDDVVIVPAQPPTRSDQLYEQLSKQDRVVQKESWIQPEVEQKNEISGQSLYYKAIDAIRSNSLTPVPRYKTFSTRDFPKAEKPDPYRRPSSIPVIISEPKTTVFTGNDGRIIVKRTDGFGNVSCSERRGTIEVFELTNPPLWYPLPAAACSFIK